MRISFLILCLFVGFQTFAQSKIYLKGGKQISAKYVISDSRKTFVRVEADGKTSKIRNSEIDSIRIQNELLKPLFDGKKMKMFFLIAKSGNRELAVNKTEIIKSRGGFESVQTSYNLVISDAGIVSKKVAFSNSETEKEVLKRGNIFGFVISNFSDCPKVLAHFNLFRNDTDKFNLTILNYLDKPEYLICN